MIRQIIAVLDTMNSTRYKDLSAVFKEFKSRGIEISYSEGATKGCFIFRGKFCSSNLTLKMGIVSRIDDCVGRELEIYNKAKEKGLEKILVPTYPFTQTKLWNYFYKTAENFLFH